MSSEIANDMKLSSESNKSSVIIVERLLSASPQEIFAAFEDPAKLARWWGPAGFSNTFELSEFKREGRWEYVMHGPDGRDYPNKCVFREIDPFAKIVIEHIVLPIYRLTITLEDLGDSTRVTWEQEFENVAFATSMRSFLENANNENLDRLDVVLSSVSE